MYMGVGGDLLSILHRVHTIFTANFQGTEVQKIECPGGYCYSGQSDSNDQCATSRSGMVKNSPLK